MTPTANSAQTSEKVKASKIAIITLCIFEALREEKMNREPNPNTSDAMTIKSPIFHWTSLVSSIPIAGNSSTTNVMTPSHTKAKFIFNMIYPR